MKLSLIPILFVTLISCTKNEVTSDDPISGGLPNAGATLANPMPGGIVRGYAEDDGLDIHGDHLEVFAIADAEIIFSEWGHTPWKTAPDTPNSIMMTLDTPITWKGKKVTTVFYTHLSSLQFNQSGYETPRRHVKAGEKIGVSGLGNKVAHLHLGMWTDDYNGSTGPDSSFLNYLEIADLLGHFKQGDSL